MPQNAQQQGNPTYGGVPILLSPVSQTGAAQLSSPGAPGVPSVDTESQKATYSYSTASITPDATPLDIFQLAGAANIKARLKKVLLQGSSTVSGLLTMALIRRSTAASGGTSASGTVNKFDLDDGAASVTVRSFTGDPTPGTTVGQVVTFGLPMGANVPPVILDFSDNNTKGICFEGAADFLCLSGLASVLTNADNRISATFVWTEESNAA